MRYVPQEVFIANTDRAWFDFLSSRAAGRPLDEVNFWLPKATTPMKRMLPGEPVFFKLKKPDYAIVGYGFYACFDVLDLDTAWRTFGEKNGDPSRERFLGRMGGYRGVDLLDPKVKREAIGCTVLRDAVFWPRHRWIPWGEEQGWAPNIVQGKTERDPARVALLMAAMAEDARSVPRDLAEEFRLVSIDAREVARRDVAVREGQGTFRLRLIDAYAGQCAITGEHTVPVLDAAHIQPYLGPESNHVQNGLLLTKEFHALFDEGYVTITPDYRVRVSERLRADWRNGKRYYPYDGQRLVVLPDEAKRRPSRDALAWHEENVFLRTG